MEAMRRSAALLLCCAAALGGEPPSTEDVLKAVREMGSPEFEAREAATKRILGWGLEDPERILGILPVLGHVLGLLAIPWAVVLLYMGIGAVLETHGAKQLLFLIAIFVVYLAVAAVPMSLLMKLRA